MHAMSTAVWVFVASVVGRATSHVGLNVLAQRGGARAKSELRQHGLHSLDRLGPGRLTESSSVSMTTLLANGVDALDAYFGRYIPQLLLAAIQTPLLLAVLWVSDIPTGVAITIVLPLIPVFMVLIGLVTRTIQKKQWDALSELGRAFIEIVDGLSTLKIFGRHWRQVTRIRKVTDDFRKKTMAVLRVSFLSSFVLELAASLSVAIVAVSIGIRLINGDLPLWLGLFVLVLVPDVFLPLRQVGAQFHQAADGLAAAEDLFDLFDKAEQVPWREPTPTGQTMSPEALTVDSFAAQRDGRPVFDPLSFTIEPGEIVVVSGPSGVGKTSLLLALLGFVEHQGKVLVGDTDITPHDIRSRLAWSPQHPSLGQGTVAHNVAAGASHLDKEALQLAVQYAGATDIDQNMMLGVAGAGLSGGQAARVSLARAYYRVFTTGAHILLLDEPTAALDRETESGVVAGFSAASEHGISVLVVSHRDAVLSLPAQHIHMGSHSVVRGRE